MVNMIPNFIKVDIMRLNPRKKRNQYLMLDLQKFYLKLKIKVYLICLSAFSGNLLLNHYIIIRFIFIGYNIIINIIHLIIIIINSTIFIIYKI